MKKIIAIIFASVMALSLVACGNKDDAGTTTTPVADGANVITPNVIENTVGSTLWNAFLEGMKANEETTPEEMVNTLSTNPVIQFMPMAMPVEAGFLAGFSAEITGFEKGAVYMPMMGSIAFAGYVFELAEDADVNAFIKTLNDNCDPRWNICVEADYIYSGAYNNTVFFLMYQSSLDEAQAGGAPSEAVIIEPTVAAGTWGETLWNVFGTAMNDNPSATASDLAFILATHETIPFMSGSSEVLPGFLMGFDEEISGFKSASMFGPMISATPFIGYVFELEEGADVNAFITLLTEKSNPSWNICVSAEQTVVGSYNNMVFFLMCKTSNASE